MYDHPGHAKDTPEHQAPIDKYGFKYHSLLGKLMYVYISCRPDIGYAVVTLGKFANGPADYHFSMLKKVVKYLPRTMHWGLNYKRSTPNPSPPPCTFHLLFF